MPMPCTYAATPILRQKLPEAAQAETHCPGRSVRASGPAAISGRLVSLIAGSTGGGRLRGCSCSGVSGTTGGAGASLTIGVTGPAVPVRGLCGRTRGRTRLRPGGERRSSDKAHKQRGQYAHRFPRPLGCTSLDAPWAVRPAPAQSAERRSRRIAARGEGEAIRRLRGPS